MCSCYPLSSAQLVLGLPKQDFLAWVAEGNPKKRWWLSYLQLICRVHATSRTNLADWHFKKHQNHQISFLEVESGGV